MVDTHIGGEGPQGVLSIPRTAAGEFGLQKIAEAAGLGMRRLGSDVSDLHLR